MQHQLLKIIIGIKIKWKRLLVSSKYTPETKRLAFDWTYSSFTVLKANIIDIRYSITPIIAAKTTRSMSKTTDTDKMIPGTCQVKEYFLKNLNSQDTILYEIVDAFLKVPYIPESLIHFWVMHPKSTRISLNFNCQKSYAPLYSNI